MKVRSLRVRLGLIPTLVLSFCLALWATIPARAASPAWKLITYERVQFEVPSDWPVVDLPTHPRECVRFDVRAVYLGSESPQPTCPAVVIGRTNTVQVERLDLESASRFRFSAASTTVNGEVAYLALGTTAGGTIAAAFPQLGALVTLSFGTDPALSERILSTFTHAPGTTRLSQTFVPSSRASPASPNSAPPAPSIQGPTEPRTIYTGKGFDTCTAPSTGTMAAWIGQSPYRSVGIYIGGIERGCDQPNLTPSWIATVEEQGWNLVPTYVGLQAPCTNYAKRIDPRMLAPRA